MSLPRPPLPAPRDSTSDDKTKSLNQKTQSVEEKLDDLSAYIMAKGLYKKCGGKMAQGIQMCKVYPVECFAEVWYNTLATPGLAVVTRSSSLES
jgi:hypothetical protein